MDDILAGALGGNMNVWQAVVTGDAASDVSGALEAALSEFQNERPGIDPIGASVFHNIETDSYAVVLMLAEPSNG